MINEELESANATIKKLQNKITELEDQIQKMSVPIIPSVMPSTILVPFVGDLYQDRFRLIVPQVLNYVSERETETVILDFTAITEKETINLTSMGEQIENLTASLDLMGCEVLIVGLSPQLSRALTESGLPFIQQIECFLDFKTSLEHQMKKRGLKMIKVVPGTHTT